MHWHAWGLCILFPVFIALPRSCMITSTWRRGTVNHRLKKRRLFRPASLEHSMKGIATNTASEGYTDIQHPRLSHGLGSGHWHLCRPRVPVEETYRRRHQSIPAVEKNEANRRRATVWHLRRVQQLVSGLSVSCTTQPISKINRILICHASMSQTVREKVRTLSHAGIWKKLILFSYSCHHMPM